MGAVEKISRAYQPDKENRVRQDTQPKNRFRKQMPFLEFVAHRNKLGIGKKTQVAKPVSEEIAGSFDDPAISDAVYAYFSSTADVAEKQVAANELAAKIVAMSQSGDVILLAASLR